MRLPLLIGSLLLFSACNSGILGQDNVDTATGDTGSTVDTASQDTASQDTASQDTASQDTGTNACTATVISTSPRPDETNVAVNKVMMARFSAPVGENDWSLTVDGVSGTSALSSNGLSATFEADAPLDTNTDYTMHASACGHPVTVHFTTASGPLPASDLTGNTYAIDYNDITWVQPANIGGLVSSYVNIQYLLVAILDVNTDAQTIHVGASLGITDQQSGDIVQDPCSPPYDLGTHDFSGNPVFDAGPADLVIGSNNLTVSNAEIKAAFVDSGNAIQDIRISGQIDTSNASLDVCSYGWIPCTTCVDNPSSDTCVDVLLVADHADKVDGLVFDPNLDPSQNPSCN